MRRNRGLRGLFAVVAILTGTIAPLAQGDRQVLADLVEKLGLTPAGAPGWLLKLGVGSGSHRKTERLLLVTLAGDTILEVDGVDQHVPASDDLNARLYGAGAGLVLIHNHPSSTGLSANDLMQLGKPRVSAVAAIGHDGSIYVAAAGARYAGHAFERVQYRVACSQVEQRLFFYLEGPTARPWRASASLLLAHLVARALSQASVIEYVAFLSPGMSQMYTPLAGHGDRAIAAAVERLDADHRGAQPHERRSDTRCGPDISALSHVLANVQSRVTV